MKKVLFLVASLVGSLVGCATSTSHSYPVELPHGIHAVYVECNNDLDCQSRVAGVCQNGYWIAETMSSLTPLPHQIGIVIVCDNEKK